MKDPQTMSVRDLISAKNQAMHAAREILDRCVEDGRERTAHEEEMFNRANADYDRYDNEIRAREADSARRDVEAVVRPAEGATRSRTDERLARWIRGDRNAANDPNGRDEFIVDMRPVAARVAAVRRAAPSGSFPEVWAALQTDGGDSGGSLVVPTDIASTVYGYLESSSAMRRVSTILTTDHGNPMTYPKVVTHSVGTQIATEDTAIGGTDPVLGTMTLSPFDYGELIHVSSNMIEDTTIDVVEFVGSQIGRALGRITDTAYVTGAGTTEPTGVVTALTGSVATGGSLVEATFEKLIDLKYSIADEYHPRASWMFRGSTAASLRKIRAGAGGTEGDFIWEPSTQAGEPDRLLGNPVFLDGNVAAQGSAAKSVLYGDFSAYYVRDVVGVRLARSDDFKFDKAQASFRGILRTDGNLIDAAAIKYLHQRT